MILYDPRYNIKKTMSARELAQMVDGSESAISKIKKKRSKFLGIYYILDEDEPIKTYKDLYSSLEYDDEGWIPLKENPDKYLISNYGRLKVYHPVGKFYTFVLPYQKSNGKTTMKNWLVIKVDINGEYKEKAMHILVANSFLEKPTNLTTPVLFHKNGVVYDNKIDNLTYIERSELGKFSGGMSNSRAVKCVDTLTGEVSYYRSGREAARNIFCSYQAVFDNLNGKTRLAGYRYKLYWEEDDYE